VTLNNKELPQVRILLYQHSVGIASWIVLIIQNPNLHATLFTFGKDNIHVAPPPVLAEILVGTRLNADCTATARLNTGYLLWNLIGSTSALPIKRKQVIFPTIVEDII
jgi:hypothetical protein